MDSNYIGHPRWIPDANDETLLKCFSTSANSQHLSVGSFEKIGIELRYRTIKITRMEKKRADKGREKIRKEEEKRKKQQQNKRKSKKYK